jgi:3D (Asp-Asp-Asp) domain-containing protein
MASLAVFSSGANLNYWDCGDKFKIEGYGDTNFEVTDTGSDLEQYHFDIFVGPMWKEEFEKAYPNTYQYHRVEKRPR